MSTAQVVIIGQHDFASIVSCFPDKRYIIIMTNDAATLSQSTSCSLGEHDSQCIVPMCHESIQALHGELRPFMEVLLACTEVYYFAIRR